MTDWLTEEWQWIYLAAESCLATCANTLERSHITSCQRWLRNESNWILQSAQIDRIWFLILNNKDDFSLITLQSHCSQSSEVEALSAQSGSAHCAVHRHCREANRQCQHLAREIFRCCWKCSDWLSPAEYRLEHGTALRSGGNIHMNKDELISGCSSVFWLPHIFWNSVQCWRCNGENPERTKWGRALWIPLEPGNHWLCGFLLLLGLRCNPSARGFPGLVHSCQSAFWHRYPLQLLP